MLFHNAFLMAERVKTFSSVIGTHTASPYTAEPHVRGGQVNNGVIDTSAAERHLSQKPLFCLLVSSKQIQSQRLILIGLTLLLYVQF